jgi:hypothetical protein
MLSPSTAPPGAGIPRIPGGIRTPLIVRTPGAAFALRMQQALCLHVAPAACAHTKRRIDRKDTSTVFAAKNVFMLVFRKKLHNDVLRLFAFMLEPFAVNELAETHRELIIEIKLLIIGFIFLESLVFAE